MRRFVLLLSLVVFVLGFGAVLARPQRGSLAPDAAAGGTAHCMDPQPGKGKNKSFDCSPVVCGPCEEEYCNTFTRCWSCRPIPDCVP